MFFKDGFPALSGFALCLIAGCMEGELHIALGCNADTYMRLDLKYSSMLVAFVHGETKRFCNTNAPHVLAGLFQT